MLKIENREAYSLVHYIYNCNVLGYFIWWSIRLINHLKESSFPSPSGSQIVNLWAKNILSPDIYILITYKHKKCSYQSRWENYPVHLNTMTDLGNACWGCCAGITSISQIIFLENKIYTSLPPSLHPCLANIHVSKIQNWCFIKVHTYAWYSIRGERDNEL